MTNEVHMMCTCCTDRRKPASITAINLPLKRIILNPFQDAHEGHNPLSSAEPTLLTLQIGQKYFLPDKSYVRDDRAWPSCVLWLYVFLYLPTQKRRRQVFARSVRSQRQIRYLMNASNNFEYTDRGCSPAPTGDLIRFWRSKVKVTAGRRSSKGIHVDAGASKSIN